MPSNELQERFNRWVENALQTSPPPDEVIAFSFNLYEGPFSTDLIGSPVFDSADSDWATDEAWEATPRLFALPDEEWGSGWEEALQNAVALVTRYLEGSSPGPKRLQSSRAVAVGFHDGDLHVVAGAAV